MLSSSPLLNFFGFFAPCRDVVESCCRCLTEHATTIERRREGGERRTKSWFITIISYQQVGSGRSATDPKWKAFGQRMSVSAYKMERDMVVHPPAAVKVVWDSCKPYRWTALEDGHIATQEQIEG